MKTLATIVLLLAAALNAAAETPRKSMDLSRQIPDLCQTDPAGQFANGGVDNCAPASVSNSLIYLAKHGFPKLRPSASTDKDAQIKLINMLASKEYMDTEEDGTSPTRVMTGVQRAVEEAGYQVARLEHQGLRQGTKKYPVKAEVPSLEWIKEGLSAKNGAVWLNVGFYTSNPGTNEFQRVAGHWVTLVGYGKSRSGKADPLSVIVHDPATRAGTKPFTQFVQLSVLDKGTLQRKLSSGEVRQRDAQGYYQLKGEMKLKSGTDTCVLDAVVVMEVE